MSAVTQSLLKQQITVRPFQPGDETAFRELNEVWIRQYFTLEKKDQEVLGDPKTHVLDPGGHILMAVKDGEPVGCCALLAMGDGCLEVGKMAVSESQRGLGIGRILLAEVIEYAKGLGAKRLFLESNSKLANAIHLYETSGFQHLPPERVQRSPYARSNVSMELLFLP